MNHKNKERQTLLYVVFAIFITYGVIWSFTGNWPWTTNSYNSYVLQAKSWLEGRLDLGQNYSHLEIAIFEGKYFVSFPPLPSIIYLPFVFLFGENFKDQWASIASTLVCAYFLIKLIRMYVKEEQTVAFFTIFMLLGSNLMFVSVNGWVWFIAQNLCFTLSVMTIYYACRRKGGLAFFCWALSIGCRPFQVIYFPLICLILYRGLKKEEPEKTLKDFIKEHYLWSLPTAVVAMVYMWLNYARFHSIVEFGHNYLPEFREAEYGQFHIRYLVDNIGNLFRLPEISDNHMLSFPTFNGSALWISMPIFITYFIYLIYRLVKKNVDCKSMIAVQFVLMVVHTIGILMHRTLGGWHFGNRYFIDLLPYLFYSILLLRPKEKDPLLKPQYLLCFFGILINLIGTIAVYNYWI